MRRCLLLGAICLAGVAGGCGSTRKAPPASTTPATAAQPARQPTQPRATPPATTSTTTTSRTRSTTPSATPRPTPQQEAKAKALLRQCQREDPSITLRQLEQEAASPHGIQC